MIIPYKAINCIFTTIYGIIAESLSAKFSWARYTLKLCRLSAFKRNGIIDELYFPPEVLHFHSQHYDLPWSTSWNPLRNISIQIMLWKCMSFKVMIEIFNLETCAIYPSCIIFKKSKETEHWFSKVESDYEVFASDHLFFARLDTWS